MEVEVSAPLAFAAGAVSFLSPCVLPVVPPYLALVTGLTLEELTRGASPRAARSAAALHSALFMAGFGVIFMTMGLVATPAGARVASALPWMTRAGGVLVAILGLGLAGLLRLPGPARASRDRSGRWAGALGSAAAGVTFGAGWTPCIGPVLGSVLVYAALDATRLEGTLLLGVYALGLSVPFVAASLGLQALLAARAARAGWLVPLRRTTGALLVAVGALLATGHFASMTASLAALGQLINLEAP